MLNLYIYIFHLVSLEGSANRGWTPIRADVLLTPDCHESGKEDGSTVVKEVGEPGVGTAGVKAPVRAAAIAQRTHGEVASSRFVTDVLTVRNGQREVL